MSQNVRIKETPAVHEDTALNDSDKTITVPAGEVWELLTVEAQLATSATAGNRQLAVELDGASSENLGRFLAGATQAASATERYEFAAGLPRETSPSSNELQAPLPSRVVLGPGMSVRVFDLAAVDAAADDLEVRLLYLKREA